MTRLYQGFLTDVGGIRLGHAQDNIGGTGLSIIIPDANNTAAVEVRGSAPGTRETDLLNPINQVSSVNAIILSGGSAYGLSAASDLMEVFEKDGLGFDVGVGRVPILSQAVLFDLAYKDPLARPSKKMAIEAYKNASYDNKEMGLVGAGAGATCAKAFGMAYAKKSGLGQASIRLGELVVSAIAIVNALGDVFDSERAIQLAGPIIGGKMVKTMDHIDKIGKNFADLEAKNTSLGLIATNATFDKTRLTKICQMGHDGFARAINPVHTMFDGDSIFGISTNKIKADVTIVGALGAKVMARAIANAIYSLEK
ncbi:MAG: P1 family peptidase [Anaerococcus sp.]|nr:P1 family peptidase [Anaerococcus sp.]